ncbi:MAG: hypothetical protein IPL96_09850 [Holophagaceae bacterium]|nr:hypothetical protein [Holophagaceae bacterium]
MSRWNLLARRAVPAVAALVLILVADRALEACGFSSEPVFVHTLFPDHGHFEAYAKGDLGLVQPTFARSYLVVAYRHLSGAGMDDQAQQDALRLWWEREGFGPERKDAVKRDRWEDGGRNRWKAIRKQVVEGEPKLASPYSWDANYAATAQLGDPVFAKAAETLEARIKSHGAKDPWVLSWVKGQDEIFSGEKTRSLPEAAPAIAPAWFKQDRAYQLAAARFHLGQLAEAKAGFAAIAADRSSPWSDLGAYLAARAGLREAAKDPAKLSAVRSSLEALVKDPKRAAIHTDAKAMLDRATYLADPPKYVAALGARLSAKGAVADFHDALDNYTYAWDRIIDGSLEIPDASRSSLVEKDGEPVREARATHSRGLVGEEMSDWIRIYTGHGEEALARWRRTPTLPWLVAALAHAGAKDPEISKLLESAAKVDAKSPAFLTLAYHRARLLSELGRIPEADRLTAELQARPGLPPTLFNLLRQSQQKRAKDLKAWIGLLPQKIAGITEAGNINTDPPEPTQMEDVDSADISRLQTLVPLDALKDAALDPASSKLLGLPAMALEKALLAGREDLVKALHKPDPKKPDEVDAWLAEQEPAGRAFILALRAGRARNRACFPKTPEKEPGLPVLSKAQQEAAAKEQAAIEALGPSVDQHCKAILAFEAAHPDDPRIPEALHQAVQLTRTGGACGSEETTKLSKRAFQLLHKRFPKDPWARKTPYHY